MVNDVTRARQRRLAEFTLTCNRIPERGRVSRSLIRKIEAFRLPLKAMKDDVELGKLAENRLAVLDEVLAYCRENNAGNETEARRHKEKAHQLHKKGDVIADKIADRREINGD